MAYCTAEEILGMIKPDMLDAIIDDEYRETEEERQKAIWPLAEEACNDAQAEIDGYLAKRCKVPFARIPKIINKLAKDIAIYNLVSRRGVDEGEREKTYLTRYNAAIKFLTQVADGRIDVGETEGDMVVSAAGGGFAIRSSGRTFTRESMRGW